MGADESALIAAHAADSTAVTTGLAPLRRAAAKANTMSNGRQAGLASDFGKMSHVRMAPGGTFAHVLPLTAAHATELAGLASHKWKRTSSVSSPLSTCSDLESMSADTAMTKCAVVATKRQFGHALREPTSDSLRQQVNAGRSRLSQGYAIAQEIAGIAADRDQGTL